MFDTKDNIKTYYRRPIHCGRRSPPRSAYDAAGDILTDTRTGALGLTYQYDVEGRLSKTYQTNATANGATYSYDAQGRLSSRTVTQSSAPTSTTTLYLYDLSDHIIAEMDTSGQTLKEYIWLDDMPVAVVDGVNTATPTIYYVHVDHLMRPIRMTAQDWTWVWDVTYAPFGATTNLYTNPEVMNGRFPGQWFQLETGLAYNWHRITIRRLDATSSRIRCSATKAERRSRGSRKARSPARRRTAIRWHARWAGRRRTISS